MFGMAKKASVHSIGRNLVYLVTSTCISFFQVTVLFHQTVLAQTTNSGTMSTGHQHIKNQATQMIAIDRLDFYAKSLSGHLDGKKDDGLVLTLKSLTIEDYLKENLAITELSEPAQWDRLLIKILKRKNPSINVEVSDLRWDYNFFKNKLMNRFKLQDSRIEHSIETEIIQKNSAQTNSKTTQLSIPKIQGDEVLLDYEHYISEKTTRGIIWDAILNHRDFIFQIGTQKDFNDYIRANAIEVLGEVVPYSRNYNKIFLIFNPKTNKYSYIINQISGQDRVKHLMAQLRLIKMNNKSYINQNGKVIVLGNAEQFLKDQTEKLTDLFQRLPQADQAILGQKRAFEEYILALSPKAVSQVKVEMPSHEFSDYLVEDKSGQVRRWRFFSAVWGDEIIPIAKALSNSGHKEITYIGTAGALATSQLKVGDLVSGQSVLNADQTRTRFAQDDLGLKLKEVRVGQVYSPFIETNHWLRTNQDQIDIVEVETGYLLKNVSEDVKVKGYFLISDLVGSETETLAHAGKASTRRKKSQQLLIKKIFDSKNIVRAIGAYELIPANKNIHQKLELVKKLRSSREPLSQVQLSHVLSNNVMIAQIHDEKMIKSTPAFTRQDMTTMLSNIEKNLKTIDELIGKKQPFYFMCEQVLDGTLSPKSLTIIKIVSPGFKGIDLEKIIGSTWIKMFNAKDNIQIQFVDSRQIDYSVWEKYQSQNTSLFLKYYERNVLRPVAMTIEQDVFGSYKTKKVQGIETLICERLFN